MDWVDISGHLAYIMMIIGQLFITKKQAKGFIFRIIGGVIWVLLGGFLSMSSIIIWSAVFAGVDIYGFWKWMQNRDTKYMKTMIKEVP